MFSQHVANGGKSQTFTVRFRRTAEYFKSDADWQPPITLTLHELENMFGLKNSGKKRVYAQFLLTCPECGKIEWLPWSKWKVRSACGSKCHAKIVARSHLGSASPLWRGGFKKIKHGYIGILDHGHPKANRQGYVPYHRWLIEKKIGRFLTKDEVVHHIDLNKCNNSIENLQLMSNSEHVSLHRRLDGLTPQKSKLLTSKSK